MQLYYALSNVDIKKEGYIYFKSLQWAGGFVFMKLDSQMSF